VSLKRSDVVLFVGMKESKVKVRVEKKIGDGVLSFETGELAKQAAAAVLVQYNETIVLSTAVSGPARPGIDFFPLTCDYRERSCAAGKFPGGFIKREGRPTTKETLTSRLVDRPIRPMFAPGFTDEVQCQNFVLSSDRQTDGDVLAMNGAATACFISPMPFEDPVASVRVGRVNGQLIPFPTLDQLEESDMDVIVSATDKLVTMIEGFAREVPEAEMLQAIEFAHQCCKEIIQMQRDFYDQVKPEKKPFQAPAKSPLLANLKDKYYSQLKSATQIHGKQDRAAAVVAVKEKIRAEFLPDPGAEGALSESELSTAIHDLEERVVRDCILEGTRADGRDSKTLRPIVCKTDLLPRVHGSSLFQRGETQALITVTLGTGRDEQRVDGLSEEYSKKFMLDYNFPSFSVGECRPIRGPGRREIGHGALAERSINPVLPDPDDFPYTIRIVSDILESNGSSSMATVCGTTLGLMSAGVKIKNPVAGISIGLVLEGDQYQLLTDILGSEDHHGDMDFKVAGTQNGVTGIQLDLKIRGVSTELLKHAMVQSREARIEILRKMLTAIPRPAEELSPYAPRLIVTNIDPEKIGMLIGPGGKNIRAIQEQTETVIEVAEDGRVTIAGTNSELAQVALKRVEACTATVQIGKIYDGVVSSVKEFGAFVEILPGRDGLCHVSELSTGYIENVEDVCQIGDEMKVLVIDIDGNDRVKLSRRRALEELGLEDDLVPVSGDDDGLEDGRSEGDRGREDRGDRDRGRSGGGRHSGGGGGGRSGGRPSGSGGGGGRNRGRNGNRDRR
jgi:polyribonucleotide nucleotidyltransferase